MLGIDRVHPEVVILFRHSIYSVAGIEKLQRRVEYHQWKSEKKEQRMKRENVYNVNIQ